MGKVRVRLVNGRFVRQCARALALQRFHRWIIAPCRLAAVSKTIGAEVCGWSVLACHLLGAAPLLATLVQSYAPGIMCIYGGKIRYCIRRVLLLVV